MTYINVGIEEYIGKRECNIGTPFSLSVFNFIFGLLCLTLPGLLVMFTLYFEFETSNRRRLLKCTVRLKIIFFLTCFILIIGELLYSLLYVVQEVYDMYPMWRDNRTLCDEAIYISSFTIITGSYSLVFLILIGVGIYLAKRYIKWIIDRNDPGVAREILNFKHFYKQHGS